MAKCIDCRGCNSPNCDGCNLYILFTMLESGKFDCITGEDHTINPNADVVEVVRCRDCVHFQPYDGEEHKGDCAELVGLESCVYEDDFCSYGERKDGIEDIKKAKRYLDRYIELAEQGDETPVNDVKCIDCKYLELELPYAVCSMAYKGMVGPDDSCGKGVLDKKVGDNK